jgi:hypothetical protein
VLKSGALLKEMAQATKATLKMAGSGERGLILLVAAVIFIFFATLLGYRYLSSRLERP